MIFFAFLNFWVLDYQNIEFDIIIFDIGISIQTSRCPYPAFDCHLIVQ
jgi:hypothetical protein